MIDEEIAGLKEEHRTNILAGKTKQAEKTNMKLQTKIQQRDAELLEKFKSKTKLLLEKIVDNYKTNMEILENTFDDLEISVRQRCDLAFQNAQAIHIRELVRLEKAYAVERIRAKQRPVKDSMLLEKQGQVLLKIGDETGADIAFQDANESREKEMSRRISEVNKTFDAQRKITFDKQKNELRILDEKLVTHLEQLNITKQIQIEAQESQLKISVQAALHKVNEQISLYKFSRKQKADISKELKIFAEEYIRTQLDKKFNLSPTKADPNSSFQ